MNRLLSMISLSKKAGKLLVGFDRVKDASCAGKVKLLLTATDLSEKTLKSIAYLSDTENIACRVLPITMDELWYEIGQRTGILAITDAGFAKKICSMLDIGESTGETGK